MVLRIEASAQGLTTPEQTSLSDIVQSTAGKGSGDVDHNPGYTMRSMLEDDVFSDAVVKVGSKSFRVHRAILACQSEVFKRMFLADMKEKKEGVVVIFDIDPDVMSDFLSFIYTGSAPNIKKKAKDLLFAADKYNMYV